MGVRVEILGEPVEVLSYEVEESGTPLSGSDSSGGVGSIRFELPPLDDAAVGGRISALRRIGPGLLKGAEVTIADSRRGTTIGRIVDYRESDLHGGLTIECETRLADLNIYGVTAAPYAGTLQGAFEYYLSLAGVTTGIYVDPALATRAVVYPGWTGELWYNLKRMAAAEVADIALVSNTITLRPSRQNRAHLGLATSRSRQSSSRGIAQAVEVYCYHSRQISAKLVWPNTPSVSSFSVNAGEIVQNALEFSATLTAVLQPVAQDWVSPFEANASVYSVISGDGERVPADLWRRHGGRVDVILDPDGTSARLIITAPRGLMLGGKVVNSFSLADFADFGRDARRQTLRIAGTGIAYTKELIRAGTGVPPSVTENEVGATVDNPFIRTYAQAYRVLAQTAFDNSGLDSEVSGELWSVTQLNTTGETSMPTNADVAAAIAAVGGVTTNAQVQQYYTATLGLVTNADVEGYWYSTVRNRFENQTFGNLPGARLYDKKSRMWYRVRNAGVSPDAISITAQEDTTNAEAQATWGSLTYAGVQALFQGLTYEQAHSAGLWTG